MEKEKPKTAKSDLDAAIYQQVRDLLPHSYLTTVARRNQLPAWKVRRIMLGYWNEADGTHKNIREEILKKVETLQKAKTRDLQRISPQLQTLQK